MAILEGVPDPIPAWYTKLGYCALLVEMNESVEPDEWKQIVASPEYRAVINRLCGLPA